MEDLWKHGKLGLFPEKPNVEIQLRNVAWVCETANRLHGTVSLVVFQLVSWESYGNCLKMTSLSSILLVGR